MADPVEQCGLIPAVELAANGQLARPFDLNRAASDSGEGDDSSTDTGSHEPHSTSVSDCESSVSGNASSCSSAASLSCFGNGLIRLSAGDKVHDLIEGRFMSGLGSLGDKMTIVAIHKSCPSGAMAQARAQAFQIYMHATQKKRGGNANVKYAWCAASMEDITKILSYGFSHCGSMDSSGLYGSGVYLSPDNHPLESVRFAPIDRNGVKHLLLCRVILGQSELVHPGSEQCHPSSEEFDSGVDNLSCPKKYVVWSTHMNTHILPEYIVSLQARRCFRGFIETHSPARKPTSAWMPFPLLISELSKILPAATIRSISKYHKDYKENNISRQELIRKVRRFTGDNLLITIIKSFRNKQVGYMGGINAVKVQ